jgi:hypothetical protein
VGYCVWNKAEGLRREDWIYSTHQDKITQYVK